MNTRTFLCCAALALPTLALAQAVAVIVDVPKPWYAPNSLVVSKMRDAMPQYEAVPGLAHKTFTLGREGTYGGIYLWKDAAAARDFFSPAWHERVQKDRGVPGRVRFFDALLVLDNRPGHASTDSRAVATLVMLPLPAGASREQIEREFNAALPRYQAIPGLLRKAFIVTDDARLGGIYLWQDAASAERWFSAAWREAAVKAYGSAPVLEWFDAPIILPAKAQP